MRRAGKTLKCIGAAADSRSERGRNLEKDFQDLANDGMVGTKLKVVGIQRQVVIYSIGKKTTSCLPKFIQVLMNARRGLC